MALLNAGRDLVGIVLTFQYTFHPRPTSLHWAKNRGAQSYPQSRNSKTNLDRLFVPNGVAMTWSSNGSEKNNDADTFYGTSCALTNISRPFGRTERRPGSRDSGFRMSNQGKRRLEVGG